MYPGCGFAALAGTDSIGWEFATFYTFFKNFANTKKPSILHSKTRPDNGEKTTVKLLFDNLTRFLVELTVSVYGFELSAPILVLGDRQKQLTEEFFCAKNCEVAKVRM